MTPAAQARVFARFERALLDEAARLVSPADPPLGGSVGEGDTLAARTLRNTAAIFRTAMTPAELAAVERMGSAEMRALARSIGQRISDQVLARALDRSARRAQAHRRAVAGGAR